MKRLSLVMVSVTLTLISNTFVSTAFAGSGAQIKNGKVIKVTRSGGGISTRSYGSTAEQAPSLTTNGVQDPARHRSGSGAGSELVEGSNRAEQNSLQTRAGGGRALDSHLKPAAGETVSFGSDVFVDERNFYLGSQTALENADNKPYALSRASVVEGHVSIDPLAPEKVEKLNNKDLNQKNAESDGPLHGQQITHLTADNQGRPVAVADKFLQPHLFLVADAVGKRLLMNADVNDPNGTRYPLKDPTNVNIKKIHALTATGNEVQYANVGGGKKANFLFAAVSDNDSWATTDHLGKPASHDNNRGIAIVEIKKDHLNPVKADALNKNASALDLADPANNKAVRIARERPGIQAYKILTTFQEDGDALANKATVDFCWDDHLQKLYVTQSRLQCADNKDAGVIGGFMGYFDPANQKFIQGSLASVGAAGYDHFPFDGATDAKRIAWIEKGIVGGKSFQDVGAAFNYRPTVSLYRPRVMHTTTNKDYLMATGGVAVDGGLGLGDDVRAWINAIPLVGKRYAGAGKIAKATDLTQPIAAFKNAQPEHTPYLDRSLDPEKLAADANSSKVSVGLHPRYFAQTGADMVTKDITIAAGALDIHRNLKPNATLAADSLLAKDSLLSQNTKFADGTVITAAAADQVLPAGTRIGDGSQFDKTTFPQDFEFGQDSVISNQRIGLVPGAPGAANVYEGHTNLPQDTAFLGGDFDGTDHIKPGVILKRGSVVKANTATDVDGVWEQTFDLYEGAVIPADTTLPKDTVFYNRTDGDFTVKVDSGAGGVDIATRAGEVKYLHEILAGNKPTLHTNNLQVDNAHRYVGVIGDVTLGEHTVLPVGTVLPAGTLLVNKTGAQIDANKLATGLPGANLVDQKIATLGADVTLDKAVTLAANQILQIPAVGTEVALAGATQDIVENTVLGTGSVLNDVTFTGNDTVLPAGSMVGADSLITQDSEFNKLAFTVDAGGNFVFDGGANQLQITQDKAINGVFSIHANGADIYNGHAVDGQVINQVTNGQTTSFLGHKTHVADFDTTAQAVITLYPALILGQDSKLKQDTILPTGTVIKNVTGGQIDIAHQNAGNIAVPHNDTKKLFAAGDQADLGLKPADNNTKLANDYDIPAGVTIGIVPDAAGFKLPDGTKLAHGTVVPARTKVKNTHADVKEIFGMMLAQNDEKELEKRYVVNDVAGYTVADAEITIQAGECIVEQGKFLKDFTVPNVHNEKLIVTDGGDLTMKANSNLKASTLGDVTTVAGGNATIKDGGSVTFKGVTNFVGGMTFAKDIAGPISGNLKLGGDTAQDQVIGQGTTVSAQSEFPGPIAVPAGATLKLGGALEANEQVLVNDAGGARGDVSKVPAGQVVTLRQQAAASARTLAADLNLVARDVVIEINNKAGAYSGTLLPQNTQLPIGTTITNNHNADISIDLNVLGGVQNIVANGGNLAALAAVDTIQNTDFDLTDKDVVINMRINRVGRGLFPVGTRFAAGTSITNNTGGDLDIDFTDGRVTIPDNGTYVIPAIGTARLHGDTTLGAAIKLVEGVKLPAGITLGSGGTDGATFVTADGTAVGAPLGAILTDGSVLKAGSAVPTNHVQARITDMEVVGDTVYIAIDDDRTAANGTEAGIFMSKAIYDRDGLVRAWTPWRRVAGHTDATGTFDIDPATGNFAYATTTNGKVSDLGKRELVSALNLVAKDVTITINNGVVHGGTIFPAGTVFAQGTRITNNSDINPINVPLDVAVGGGGAGVNINNAGANHAVVAGTQTLNAKWAVPAGVTIVIPNNAAHGNTVLPAGTVLCANTQIENNSGAGLPVGFTTGTVTVVNGNTLNLLTNFNAVNTVKFTQWKEKDGINKIVSERLEEIGGMKGFYYFDEETPGFKPFVRGFEAPNFSMAVATAKGAVAMVQMGKKQRVGVADEFDPTKNFDDTTVFVFPRNGNANDKAVLDALGNIYCAELSRMTLSAAGDNECGWLFVGGENGVAVLKRGTNPVTAAGEGFNSATGLDELKDATLAANFPAGADWQWVKLGADAKDVRKLVADPYAEFLYVLTASKVYRVKMSAANFDGGAPLANDANGYTIIAQVGAANASTSDGAAPILAGAGDAFVDMMLVQSDRNADTATVLLATTKGLFINDITDGGSTLAAGYTDGGAPNFATLVAVHWIRVVNKQNAAAFDAIKNAAKLEFFNRVNGGRLRKAAAADTYSADGNMHALGIMQDVADPNTGYLGLFRFDVQGGAVKAFIEPFTEEVNKAVGIAADKRTDYFIKYGQVEDYKNAKFFGPASFVVSRSQVPNAIGIAPSADKLRAHLDSFDKLDGNVGNLAAGDARAYIDYGAVLPTNMKFVQMVHDTASGAMLVPGEFGVIVND